MNALGEALAFSGCELRLATRELVRDGMVQSMEPRTWDLLVYLITHRDRVVPKAELLEKVWRTAFISDTVVPQAVMKARQIIGDDSIEPRLIKTVHRVGYRFIGSIGAATKAPSPDAAGRAGRLPGEPSVAAVLPFEDRTGDSTFAWVELGLMALAAKELEAGARVRAVPTIELLHELEQVPAGLGPDERATHVRQHFRADAVVHFTLFADAGGYVVAWTIFRADGETSERLAGHVPTALTIRAARQVAAALDLGHGAGGQRLFRVGQTFLNEAYARAVRARAEYLLDEAIKLLAVCVLSNDCPLEIQCEHLFMMAFLLDPATPQRGAQVLKAARAAGDRRLEGKAHMSLCLFHLYDGDFEASATAGDNALDLISNSEAPEDRGFALTCRAQLATSVYEFGYARRLIEEAQEIAERVRSTWLRVWGLQQQGVIEDFGGTAERAAEFYERSAGIARAARLRGSVAFAKAYLAQIRIGQGRFQLGRELVDEAISVAGETGHPRTQIVAHLTLAILAARTGDRVTLAAQRERLAQARLAVPKIGRGAIEITDAFVATLAGRFDQALMHLAAALRLTREQPRFWPDLRWIHCANLALLEGRPAVAEEALEALEEHPSYATNRNKQCAARLIRALSAAAARDPAEAEGCLAKARSLAGAADLAAMVDYLDAWLALDRGDGSAYGRWRAAGEEWVTATPAAALLETRRLLRLGDASNARLKLRVQLEARQWQTTPWGGQALVLLDSGEDVAPGVPLLPL